jgi:hypothetical protein
MEARLPAAKTNQPMDLRVEAAKTSPTNQPPAKP